MSRLEQLIAQLSPNGVTFKPLGTLGRRNSGTAITAAKMKALQVAGGQIRVFAGGQTVVDVAEHEIPPKDIVRRPSIIVRSRGHIGFTYYERPFTHKAEMWSYSLTDPDVDQKFVYYYLLTRVAELQQTAQATSVKLPQLGVRDTDLLLVPVPPIEVQREVVRILDHFTELEADLETELEAELEARRRQYDFCRDRLLTFHESEKIPRIPMGELGTFIRGRRFVKADMVAEGIPSIHYGEIYTHYGTSSNVARSNVRVELAAQLRFAQPGDVVIASVGETAEDVAKAVAWLGDTAVAIHDDSLAFRSEADPTYIAYVMQTAAFHAQKSQYVARGKVKRVGGESLGMIAVPVPPLEEQQRIVAILDKLETLVNDLSAELSAEIRARRRRYEYYREKLVTFPEAAA
jgi:type I restriction enzyme S subunit